MELSITQEGILILKGTPSKQHEYFVRSSIELIEIERTESDYWESREPVKDGYYIYVESDVKLTDEYIYDSDADSSEIELFTILNLRNCLLDYEKQIIEEGLCGCSSGSGPGIKCKSANSNRQIADFLLATVFVIENLVCKHHYNEAADIIEKIHGCNGICQESNSKNKKCNCEY